MDHRRSQRHLEHQLHLCRSDPAHPLIVRSYAPHPIEAHRANSRWPLDYYATHVCAFDNSRPSGLKLAHSHLEKSRCPLGIGNNEKQPKDIPVHLPRRVELVLVLGCHLVVPSAPTHNQRHPPHKQPPTSQPPKPSAHLLEQRHRPSRPEKRRRPNPQSRPLPRQQRLSQALRPKTNSGCTVPMIQKRWTRPWYRI